MDASPSRKTRSLQIAALALLAVVIVQLGVAAALASGIDAFALSVLLAQAASTGLTLWLGWVLFRDLLRSPAAPPRWLETVMPLRGRWLSFALGAPAMVLFLAGIWLALTIASLICVLFLVWIATHVPGLH